MIGFGDYSPMIGGTPPANNPVGPNANAPCLIDPTTGLCVDSTTAAAAITATGCYPSDYVGPIPADAVRCVNAAGNLINSAGVVAPLGSPASTGGLSPTMIYAGLAVIALFFLASAVRGR